ncbi:MAG: putative DNA binding domain-containing protein [Gammaproteobacteria bacterium]|nr:putative DNA binding domain-containing protein [Gammaproteobacteria bacterium]MDE0036710.1 putative DNA binding domain-containing protein [Gammaproteobacteria bacterium]
MTLALPINIDSLLHRRTIEGERIEYKAGWNPQSVLATLGAFANDFHNLGGGYVLLGVEERDGRPVLPPKGLDPAAIDGIQKELLNLGNSAIQPPYHPLTAVHDVDGRTILVLYAPGGETRPYRTKVSLSTSSREWAYFIRRHSSTVRARSEDERELLALAATVPFDDRFHRNASLDNLSFRLIQQHLQDVGSDLLQEVAELSMDALGRRMNIVGGPREALFPKNVGLLFFNDRPHEFFPATQIDVVWFPDGPGGDYFEEKEFRGPLAAILRDAVSYIERNFLKEAVVKDPHRPEAERFWNFPIAAIEEALGNAIYHRSYEEREPVEVRVMPEELLVLSYPGADRSIRMADLQRGQAVSRRYRNRRIGEFLKELDLAEGRSTGVPKILRAMRDNGSPAPSFESDEDRTWFRVRLPAHSAFALADQTAREQLGEQDTLQGEPLEDKDRETATATGQDKQLKYNESSIQPLHDTPQDRHGTPQDAPQVAECVERLVRTLQTEMSRAGLQAELNLRDRRSFREAYLKPALKAGIIEMTLPDKPTSRNQRYRRTLAGETLARRLTDSGK